MISVLHVIHIYIIFQFEIGTFCIKFFLINFNFNKKYIESIQLYFI